MLEHLVSHPSYKLLSLRAIPQQSSTAKDYSAFIWPGLMKHLRQMLVARATMEEGNWIPPLPYCLLSFMHSVLQNKLWGLARWVGEWGPEWDGFFTVWFRIFLEQVNTHPLHVMDITDIRCHVVYCVIYPWAIFWECMIWGHRVRESNSGKVGTAMYPPV